MSSNSWLSNNGPATSPPPSQGISTLHQEDSEAPQHSHGPELINHMKSLSSDLSTLFLNPDYADVNLFVESQKFPAHRIILAARSEYFRALLLGGMRESQEKNVTLSCVNVKAFKILLKYVYTGTISLGGNHGSSDLTLDVLGLSHQWGFTELEASICEHLEFILDVGNVCAILDAALAFGLTSLIETCSVFADANTSSLLQHTSFLQLSATGVSTLLARDSFCAPEEKIFEAVAQWTKSQESCGDEQLSEVLKNVRFPLMNLNVLLESVRPTGLVSPDILLDAIRAQNNSKTHPLRYRGYLVPEQNVADIKQGATVIKGEMRQAILDGDVQNYDVECGFTRHIIDDTASELCCDASSVGIVIKLKQQCILNHILMLLWDRDLRCYCYYIETSIDEEDWTKVCDHTKYHCRSWQYIYFQPRVVRYIKIVGTHNTINRMFHVVSVQAYYTAKKFELCPKTGLVIPRHNVASLYASACVIEGVSRSRNALINGETTGYDWDCGYTCHQLGSGIIVVQLAQPYIISSMRILLWDCDDRSYRYYVEVSTDYKTWTMVANKTQEDCKSWQWIKFEPLPVVYIKILGTHNTANEVFHCVHFECPAQNMLPSECEETSESPEEAAKSSATLRSEANQNALNSPARDDLIDEVEVTDRRAPNVDEFLKSVSLAPRVNADSGPDDPENF